MTICVFIYSDLPSEARSFHLGWAIPHKGLKIQELKNYEEKKKKEKLCNDFNFQISQESLYKIPISKKKVIQGTEYPHNFNTVTVNAHFTINNSPQTFWASIELRIISVNVLNIKLKYLFSCYLFMNTIVILTWFPDISNSFSSYHFRYLLLLSNSKKIQGSSNIRK